MCVRVYALTQLAWADNQNTHVPLHNRPVYARVLFIMNEHQMSCYIRMVCVCACVRYYGETFILHNLTCTHKHTNWR